MNRTANRWIILSTILAVVGVASARVVVLDHSPAPQLVNSSFEDPGEAADRAAGWGRWGHWFDREDGWIPVHTGHCLLGYHHWEIPDSKDSGVFQDIKNAVKGTEYTFGIYVNLDKTRDARQDAISIELRLESTVDGRQQTLASKLCKVADLRPDQWERLTVTGAPVNDTLRVLVIVTPSPRDGTRSGALRFDDAFLESANEHASR
jgi:hypothetical protein